MPERVDEHQLQALSRLPWQFREELITPSTSVPAQFHEPLEGVAKGSGTLRTTSAERVEDHQLEAIMRLPWQFREELIFVEESAFTPISRRGAFDPGAFDSGAFWTGE